MRRTYGHAQITFFGHVGMSMDAGCQGLDNPVWARLQARWHA